MIVTLALWKALRSLWQSPASQGLLVASGAILVVGAGFYRFVEDLSWVDSFYLAVITLTTVGYGDLAPETTAGRLFTTVYVIVGVGLLVALLSEVAHAVVDDMGETRNRDDSAGDHDGLADD